jgi:tetratricopeptide (TPR) repeat protein
VNEQQSAVQRESMNQTTAVGKKRQCTAEARRLAELARVAGLGDSPDDAIEWNERALSAMGTGEDSAFVADVLRWQAAVFRDRGETSKAAAMYTRSLDVSTRLGYDSGRAHALNHLASIELRRGSLAESANLMTEALLLAGRCGETRLVGMLQQNLGIVADIRGNPAAAQAHYRVSLAAFEATSDLQQLSGVLNNLGYLLLKEQRFDEAAAAFERALGIARARGDLMSEGIIEENRAELYLTLGELAEAWPCLLRALVIAERRNDSLRKAAALKQRGAHERLTGQASAAIDTLEGALTLSALGEDAFLGAEILYQIGLAHHALGDRWTAQNVWQAALEAFERIGARQWVGQVSQQLTRGDSTRYL